jgi:hypothetical protein
MREWIVVHRRAVVVLGVILVVGGVLRGLAAASPEERQSSDERAYARLTNHLMRQHGFWPPGMDDPVRWGPGAPMAFAAALRLSPSSQERYDVPPAYPLQAVVGTLLIAAVFVLGVLLAGAVVGLLAAAAVSLYPPLIVASGDLVTEPLGALLLVLGLIAVVLALRDGSPWRAAAAGVLLGVTVLVRVDMLAVPFLLCGVVLIALWGARGRRQALVATAAMLGGVLLLLAPWSIYASQARGKFVPVTSGGASNLFIGTYVPGDGRLYGVKEAFAGEVRRRHPELADVSYAKLPQEFVIDAIQAQHPGLDREAALYAAARDNVRDHILGDPLGFSGMAARKVVRLWWAPTRGSMRHTQEWMRVVHVPLLAIGVIGLVAGLVSTRGRQAGLWAIAVVALYVTATNIVLVAEARHNLPSMPLLIVAGFAGIAIAIRARAAAPAMPTMLRRHWRRRRGSGLRSR